MMDLNEKRLEAKIRRRLAKDGEFLRKVRSPGSLGEIGEYYIVNGHHLVASNCSLESLHEQLFGE